MTTKLLAPDRFDCILWLDPAVTTTGSDWWQDWADGWYPSLAEGLEYCYPSSLTPEHVRRFRTVTP